LSDPGLAVLASIEGVVIIDRTPPANFPGVLVGDVLVVGEFEDGPFAPTRVSDGNDLLENFGGFGFVRGTVGAYDPCARIRNADAGPDEYWNGNGFIALANKKFGGLVIQRVDTSVGSVEFSRLAGISGDTDVLTWNLEPAQILVFDTDATGNDTVTFTAAAAVKTSGNGTYPWAPVGGETLTVAIDGTQYIVTFAATDTGKAAVWARIDATLGYTATSDGGAVDKTSITGIKRGTGGSVQIVAVSAASVTTATGFSAGIAVAGTGNVVNIDAVTDAEVTSLVGTASAAAASVDRDANGNLRIYSKTALTGKMKVDTTTTATAFGFPEGVLVDAAVGTAGKIPAGTVVKDGVTRWVTMETIAVTASSAGPYTTKIRPATDDVTALGAVGFAINALEDPLTLGAFSVANPLAVVVALTEAAIDSVYNAAWDKTLNINSEAKLCSYSISARQSNAGRVKMRANAIQASNEGSRGRKAIISPPLGSTRATVRGSAQPGVGFYRSDRVYYAAFGLKTRIDAIATRGVAGGDGFTADGSINAHFAPWVASVASQLNPEENPGQLTVYMGEATALEDNTDIDAMGMADYILFKAAGIMAPRIDEGVTFIESGVTAVDPTADPSLVNASRRAMADFLQDSMAAIAGRYSKRLKSRQKRAELISEIDGFLINLKSVSNIELQRISDYTIDGTANAGNTTQSLAAGIFRVKVQVELIGSMDVIVLDTTIGEGVIVTTV
jgi:hypothetical protein